LFFVFINLSSFSAKLDSLLKTFVVKDNQENILFNNYVTIFKQEKDLTLNDLLKEIEQNKIKAIAKKQLNGFNKDYYWVFFKIKSEKESKLVIRNVTTNFNKALLFNVKTPNDTLVKVGTFFKFSEKTIASEQIVFPLDLKANSETIYVIKIIKLYDSLSMSLSLYPKKEYFYFIDKKHFFYTGFIVIMLILNLVSLIFAFVLRKNNFFYYSLYNLMMIITYGTYKNIFSFYFISEFPEINYYLKNVIFILIISFNLFTCKYLNLKQNSYRFWAGYRIMNLISLLFLILSVSTKNEFRYHVLHIFYLIMFVYLLLIFYVMISLYKQKNPNIKTFIFAFAPIVFALLITISISIELLPAKILSYDIPIIATLIEFIVFLVAMLLDVKKLNDEHNILIKEQANKQNRILQSFTKGYENTNKITSAELHDNLGSKLALLKHKAINSSNKETIINDIENIKTDILNISNIIDNKSIETIDLQNNIEDFIEEFNKCTSIKAELIIDNYKLISGEKAIEIYRVFQEALTNVLKHSKANKIVVNLGQNYLRIIDNGIGFNPKQLEQSNGIKNMTSRIKKINGNINIVSEPEKGTEVIISIE